MWKKELKVNLNEKTEIVIIGLTLIDRGPREQIKMLK